LGRLLARLWWTVNPPGRKTAAYKYSVVSGLRAAVGTAPLYDEFLRTADAPSLPLTKDYQMWVAQFGGKANSDTEHDLMSKYGYTPSEFKAARAELLRFPNEPCLIGSPLLERILEVDLADIDDRDLPDFGCSAN